MSIGNGPVAIVFCLSSNKTHTILNLLLNLLWLDINSTNCIKSSLLIYLHVHIVPMRFLNISGCIISFVAIKIRTLQFKRRNCYLGRTIYSISHCSYTLPVYLFLYRFLSYSCFRIQSFRKVLMLSTRKLSKCITVVCPVINLQSCTHVPDCEFVKLPLLHAVFISISVFRFLYTRCYCTFAFCEFHLPRL